MAKSSLKNSNLSNHEKFSIEYFYGLINFSELANGIQNIDIKHEGENTIAEEMEMLSLLSKYQQNKLVENAKYRDLIFHYYKYMETLVSLEAPLIKNYINKSYKTLSKIGEKFQSSFESDEQAMKYHFIILLGKFFHDGMSLYFLHYLAGKLLYSKNGNINLPKNKNLYSALDDAVEWYIYLESEFIEDIGWDRFGVPLYNYYLRSKNSIEKEFQGFN